MFVSKRQETDQETLDLVSEEIGQCDNIFRYYTGSGSRRAKMTHKSRKNFISFHVLRAE